MTKPIPKDVLEIFEPYLDKNDILEIIEELEKQMEEGRFMSVYVKVDKISRGWFDRAMYGSPIQEEVDITINGVKHAYPASDLTVWEPEKMQEEILKTLVDVFRMDRYERGMYFGGFYGYTPVSILEDFTFDEIKEKHEKWLKSKEIHKLTVEEIEEKLGYKVEIVSEREEDEM